MIFSERMMNQPCGYVDLDRWSQTWAEAKGYDPDGENPFIDPTISAAMVNDYHSAHELVWSYGEWMNNRRRLHRGTYLEKEERWVHIGLDVNAPAKTPIFALADGPVMYVGDDSPLVGGWGGHLIQKIGFQESSHLLVYGHLGHINARRGEHLKKGDEIAVIGNPSQNGYWFPHVHLQLVGEPDMVHGTTDWQKFSEELDGYVRVENAAAWACKCPDPTPLIFGFGG